MQDVPGNSGIDYVANGIELMCRIYCVQMIGRLKNLHHGMDLFGGIATLITTLINSQ
jgi:hypothetical protein